MADYIIENSAGLVLVPVLRDFAPWEIASTGDDGIDLINARGDGTLLVPVSGTFALQFLPGGQSYDLGDPAVFQLVDAGGDAGPAVWAVWTAVDMDAASNGNTYLALPAPIDDPQPPPAPHETTIDGAPGAAVNGPVRFRSTTTFEGALRTLTITDGGTGYRPGDLILFDPNERGRLRVIAIGPNGSVAAVEVVDGGTNTAGDALAQDATTGSGSGFTSTVLTITPAGTGTIRVTGFYYVCPLRTT